MVQAIADDFGNDGLRRDARKLLFERKRFSDPTALMT
jgi:hypothetical protein